MLSPLGPETLTRLRCSWRAEPTGSELRGSDRAGVA